MNDSCPLEITTEQWNDIQHCESVVVREYERLDGSRVARAVAWGDAEEMELQAETPAMFIVPVGFHIICQRAIPVNDLTEKPRG